MALERTPDLALLVVETLDGTSAEEIQLRNRVREVFGLDARGRPWHVERLFPNMTPQPDSLDRYFRVSGSIEAPVGQREPMVFERAYRLADATGFHVEPDLPSSLYMPPEPRFVERSIFGGGEPVRQPPKDWALKAMRCFEAWNLPPVQGGAGQGEGIVVAHPDTGYTDHPDSGLAAFDLRRDHDLLGNDDNALDPLDRWAGLPFPTPGHGTSTSLAIAGRLVTTLQGAAPRATIVPLRAISSVVRIFDSDVARAVNYARQMRAHVVSMSLGGVGFFGLEEAIDRAVAEGLIVLAAAGNIVEDVVAPAAYRNCIAVAASNIADAPWVDSAHGPKVAISAPGEEVWAPGYTFPDLFGGPRPTINLSSGTSFAVAYVAGVVALWLAHHGRENLLQRYGPAHLQLVFLHLVRTVGHRRPNGWVTDQFGVGIIDAEALLKAPLPTVPELGATEQIVMGVPSTRQPGERVARWVPELTTEEVRGRLAALFAVPGVELDPTLERYEPELTRLVAQQPAVRRALTTGRGLQPRTRSDRLIAETEPVGGAGLAGLVAQSGSPTLLRRLTASP